MRPVSIVQDYLQLDAIDAFYHSEQVCGCQRGMSAIREVWQGTHKQQLAAPCFDRTVKIVIEESGH
jgi:hypothetical protein